MSILKKTFGKDKRWVNWKPVKKGDRITKVPYAVDGKMASSTDEKTWANYAQAKESSNRIGIVFTPAQDLLGIDIDHCLIDNKINHEQKEKIAELILEADTYTEYSPSGEGLHLFLSLSAPLGLVANKSAPFEAYTSGRYFTVTEKSYGEARPVRKVSPEEALKILSIIGYPWKKVEELSPQSTGLSTSSSGLSNDQVLEKMFRSKHGVEIKALYSGDITAHDNDASKADMSFCSHLAFWTGKNAEQIEKIWIASPLGKREKTQDRKDYRDRTINAAISACKEVYENQAEKIKKSIGKLELLHSFDSEGKKRFTENTENICRILRDHPEFTGRIRYDKFRNTLEIKAWTTDKWRIVEDNDAVEFQTRIQVAFPFFSKVGKQIVYDAMVRVGKEKEFDSAMEYLRNLKWDGTRRLNTWISTVYGAPEDLYHKAVAANWIKGLVKRVMEPGCKFDYVLVLEGEQGSRKSTSLHVLGGNWHVETTMSTDNKDFFMQFQGKAIVEFSEGETLSRTEVKRMKAIITMQSDTYRPPYERTSQDFPRRCVFAMTTNQTEYLKDETGNRRWLPVTVKLPEANVDWLALNRDQIFAEAYHRVFNDKEKIYEFPKEETLVQQALRRIKDPNSDVISDWYFNVLTQSQRDQGISISQVHRSALGNQFGGKDLTRYQEMSIAEVLRTHIGLTKKQSMINSVRTTRWYDENKERNEEKPGEDITPAQNADMVMDAMSKF